LGLALGDPDKETEGLNEKRIKKTGLWDATRPL
jgi:hypothetical protein